MLKLTPEHIDQIKKYFLASDDEEKLELQRNIIPTFLRRFLNDLQQLFIYNPNDENKLVSIGKSMGAEEHIEALKEIQQEYYSQLAAVFNRGESNADIEQLLKVNNSLFANEVTFQLEIQKSFHQRERNMIKKKFREIDAEGDIQSDELAKAFRIIEREKLKDRFKEFEAHQMSMAGAEVDTYDSSISFGDEESAMAKEKTKQTFNWRRLAIAASIIGVIAFASLLLVTNERKQHDITNISNNDKPISDTNQLKRKIELQELLADNLLPFHESKLPVLKEKSFAFATEVERVIAKIYILNDKITKLEKVLSEEGKDGKEGYGSFSFSLQNRIDSLNSLINTYTFKEGVLSVYLRAETKLKIYKVGDQYFMKFNNSINYINKNSVPTSFRKVTDIAILESIKEIDYFKPN